MKNILVIDAQGGGLGKQIIQALVDKKIKADITAVGTNATATASMLKAGAKEGATGENAVIVCSKKADVIVGPLGIVIADSMLGEITPKMAVAIGQSDAERVLIPMNQCCNMVVGVEENSIKEMVTKAVNAVEGLLVNA